MAEDRVERIRLLVVDDHTLFRRGLIALLSQDERFEVTGEAGDAGEALRRLAQGSPDVILLDNHLPGVRGVDAIPSLKEAAPDTRILMLTVSESGEDLVAALHAGADGYLLKTVESEQLCDSIVKVLAGESVVSADMMSKFVNAFRAQGVVANRLPEVADVPVARPSDVYVQRMASLSARESEILALIADGASNKVIARQLDIAETTVKIHVQHILRKLQLSSRVQAAALYAASRPLT